MTDVVYTIGRLARAAGVNVETVRYYQRIKLLTLPKKERGGIRRYGADQLARLRFVKTAQALGFSLDEIAELVKLDTGLGCAAAMRIAAHKLAVVRERRRQLQRIETALARLVRQCQVQQGAVRCPLIAALQARGAG